MKTLFLVRHAKSSWDHPGLRDFDRPLSARGRAAAPAMGHFMASRDWAPELVLCSTARRAQETWALLGSAFNPPPMAIDVDELYGAGPGRMLEALRVHAGSASSAMIVAHNPGTEDLAMALCASGPERQLDRMARKYPTCALAIIDLDATAWGEIRPGSGILRRFVRPADLDDPDLP